MVAPFYTNFEEEKVFFILERLFKIYNSNTI
jgi:hypothetical protein